MGDHRRVIAIDGPAAAGKTTVARALAARLGATLFDTGALYRAVSLAGLRVGVAPEDEAALARLAGERAIDLGPPSVADGRLYDVRLDGEDVTWAIRSPAVDAVVSTIASHPAVRAALLPVQRRIAGRGAVVMVGRDIGTVVVPDAGVKLYLDASPEERARRRYRERRGRDEGPDFAAVLANVRQRDASDAGRASGPLRVPAGAIVLCTDGLSVEQVVEAAERIVRERWAAILPAERGD